MDNNSLYQDIATRTNGDIYIGVVGPVRSGKSTFLKKFMDELVLPNMTDMPAKQRVIDELPQSADGKSVMTTEPKFVPDRGVNINLADDVNVNIRLIDCVGYMIRGVENSDRKVHTPWNEQEMSFVEAAELGTRKVMREHSTIGIVVTTDGSVTDFSREDYVAAEESIVNEMKESGKPFVILLNTANPKDSSVVKLQAELSAKYSVTVVAKNVQNMNIEDIQEVLSDILGEFPLKMINMSVPHWMQMLPLGNELISRVLKAVLERAKNVCKMRDYVDLRDLFTDDASIKKLSKYTVKYNDGSVVLDLEPREELFYQTLSEMCGVDIIDESALFGYIRKSTVAVSVFDKMQSALNSAEEQGYGIVVPREDEIEFSEPEFVETNGRKSVNMHAKCSCMHIMKVDIEAEVNPIVASGSQGQEMVTYLENEYKENPNEIWRTNMLGKELREIARDGLSAKMYNMPQDTQNKLRKTVSRIVNESKGGVLCVLL